MARVRELRVVLTVDDLDGAVRFYCDALGLDALAVWEKDGGHGVLLGAGNATLELFDEPQADAVDRIEVGCRVTGPVRLAFEVANTAEAAGRLDDAGADRLAGPVETPWGDRNVRVRAPDGMQLTLFSVPEGSAD